MDNINCHLPENPTTREQDVWDRLTALSLTDPVVRAALLNVALGRMSREEALGRACLVLAESTRAYKELAIEAINCKPPAPIILGGPPNG